MADKTPINPKLPQALHAQFVAYCREHGSTQSDVVEAALKAWLTPSTDGDTIQVVCDKVVGLEVAFEKVLKVLGEMVKKMEPPPPPPPTAGYVALYPQLRQTVGGGPEGGPSPTTAAATDEASENGSAHVEPGQASQRNGWIRRWRRQRCT